MLPVVLQDKNWIRTLSDRLKVVSTQETACRTLAVMCIEFESTSAPRAPMLRIGEIHIWCLAFQLDRPPDATLTECLSAEERERAARFRFDRDGHRFVYTRGWLRRLLGEYLGVPAASLTFIYGAQGKPAVDGGFIHFNLSHSGESALYAFSRDVPLGVDIERCRPIPDWELIASRFFSPSEHKDLTQLPETDRQTGFFNCWTRKEAYLKAVGDGLSFPLGAVEVECRPGIPARLISLNGNTQTAENWRLYSLQPAMGYIGCLAAATEVKKICAWKCDFGKAGAS